MLPIIILIIGTFLLLMYCHRMKKEKLDTKTIVVISMISAISYILYMIQFIKYPQGGGISLFSMMPVMILSLLYGVNVGLTGGLIFGLLKLLNGAFVIHPAQFILDYLLSTMALGLAGVFSMNSKLKMILGCLSAITLSVFINIISGAVFFGQYAPEGMNVWLYSFVYNTSSAGVEGILTTILIAFAPIKRIANSLNITPRTKVYNKLNLQNNENIEIINSDDTNTIKIKQ